ncbi:DNA helicase [Bacteroidia bacterium]|nr:DNA helicase [Bacteroidia bacterium]
MIAPIQVYKASAGSGKTFRLTIEYIKLLLSKPHAHRHILAVSFTNKATNEMKQRILSELYGMAYHCKHSDSYLNEILNEGIYNGYTIVHPEESVIRQKAKEALNELIYDYNRFYVETIGSFYQRVLRNMAKELGIGSFFNLEIDYRKAIEQAITDFLKQLTEQSESLDWLSRWFNDKFADEQKIARFEDEIKSTANLVINEIFLAKRDRIIPFFEDKNSVETYIQMLKQGKQASQADDNKTNFNSYDLLLRNIRTMALLAEILEQMQRTNHEQNRMLLADTDVLIHRMIETNDTPFIYEKIGSQLHHILIDEFQDTSDMQWSNFKLLLEENIAKATSNLIVGDVKQAIYRFRNSNWETLNKIETMFPAGNVAVQSLVQNRRTDGVIVNFNNRLFSALIPLLTTEFEQRLQAQRPELQEVLQTAYSTVNQSVDKHKEDSGFVEVQWVDKNGRKSGQTAAIIEHVLRLKAAGINASDIMILVRNNMHISKLAGAFEAYKQEHPELTASDRPYLTILSNEAFELAASEAVRLIIDALLVIQTPQDTIAVAQLAYHYQRFCDVHYALTATFFERPKAESGGIPFAEGLPSAFVDQLTEMATMPLYELVEMLIVLFGLHKDKSQQEFLFSFLDEVKAFTTDNNTDIAAFLSHWQTLLHTKKIEISAQNQGVRAMSIHKSKGLEFHTVIVPFCEWTLTNKHTQKSFVWHEGGKDNLFEKMPIIALPYDAIMNDSVFRSVYQEETMRQWVDNLNILYVALTRPKHNLIVLADYVKQSTTTAISEFIKTVILDGNTKEKYYRCGHLIPSVDERQNDDDGNVFTQSAMPETVDFSVKTKQLNFYLSPEAKSLARQSVIESDIKKQRGLLCHALLQAITTAQDIPQAVTQLTEQGLLPASETNDYRQWLERLCANDAVKNWFSGDYTVFKEQDIIFKDTEFGRLTKKRPDRVMLSTDGRLIIVDYKTGEPDEQYRKQIRHYARLLSQIYSNDKVAMEAYLWYLDLDKIEKVVLETENNRSL